MKRILILHPEGNVNTNPNLTGLVEILCEKGYGVDIYSRRREFHTQESPCAGSRVLVTDIPDPLDTAILFAPGAPFSEGLGAELRLKDIRYDLVIGIDRGIIEAALVAKALQVPYGLLSYEIYFREEKGPEFKEPEIAACAGLSFAIAQDRVRAEHLAMENRIPLAQILHIPVAGRAPVPRRRSYVLHDALGLDRAKKIALYMGSVSRCLGTAQLFESTKSWDPSWVLVLHHRYGGGGLPPAFREHFGARRNVFYSPLPPLAFHEIHQLIDAADLGLAFYTPIVQENANTGLNIVHTGMASGKISTYLQHDLPIVINEMGEMSEHVRVHSLGRVIGDFTELGPILKAMDAEELSRFASNGHRFFRSHLDVNETVKPLLRVIAQLLD